MPGGSDVDMLVGIVVMMVCVCLSHFFSVCLVDMSASQYNSHLAKVCIHVSYVCIFVH